MTTSPETFSAGDPDAGIRVAALYEAHGRTILGLCRFLLRDATEAEDAAQQSFLSAYRSLLGGAVPREPAAWLAAIARNECWLRIKRRMHEPLALHEVPAPQADPAEAAARNADFAMLRAGLEALSRPQREAFMLREFAGLSYSELALALGVSEPAVDSLLFRARTSLRRALRAANGILVPVALRDQLARLIPGFDQPAAGTLAKLASLPFAAKLAAAGASAVLVVAGSTGFDRHVTHTRVAAAMPGSAVSSRRSAPVRTHRTQVLVRLSPAVAAPALGNSGSRAPRVVRRAVPSALAPTQGESTSATSATAQGDDPTASDAAATPPGAPPPTVDGSSGPTFSGARFLPPESTPDDPITEGAIESLTIETSGSGGELPSPEDSGSSGPDSGSPDSGSPGPGG